ncbi:hypothetical protein BRD22_05150 [Halobacteriales archaeon SW_8_68_21]|nr:MAG: hypothetical protein BRD22_05150 [Halobacteriales archaeon SW_8_68_21]
MKFSEPLAPLRFPEVCGEVGRHGATRSRAVGHPDAATRLAEALGELNGPQIDVDLAIPVERRTVAVESASGSLNRTGTVSVDV